MAKRFLQLNGLAILAVVFFHAAGWGFTAMFAWPHRYLPVTSPDFSQMGTTQYYVLRFVEQLAVFSIPAFLAISGTFVAVSTGALARTRWDRALGRLKSLIPPYLTWTAALAALQIIQGSSISLQEIPGIILTGSINPAYYFVPLLAQYYLLSPVLTPFARKKPVKLLIATWVLQLTIYLIHYLLIITPGNQVIIDLAGAFPKWFFPTRLFWFSLGLTIGFHAQKVREILSRIHVPLILASVLLFIIGLVEWEFLVRQAAAGWVPHRETLVDGIYSLSFIGAMLATPAIGGRMFTGISQIGARSYGIYLTHSPAMEYLARGIYHLAPWILGVQAIFQILLVSVGLLVPLILMRVVRRRPFNVVYRFVFG